MVWWSSHVIGSLLTIFFKAFSSMCEMNEHRQMEIIHGWKNNPFSDRKKLKSQFWNKANQNKLSITKPLPPIEMWHIYIYEHSPQEKRVSRQKNMNNCPISKSDNSQIQIIHIYRKKGRKKTAYPRIPRQDDTQLVLPQWERETKIGTLGWNFTEKERESKGFRWSEIKCWKIKTL